MNTKNLFYFIVFLVLLSSGIQSQIKIKELPEDAGDFIPEEFLCASDLRETVRLSEGWTVYPPDEPENRVKVSVPNSFEGIDELTYDYKFELTAEQINSHVFVLNFLGINYSADIFVNGQRIYRHNNGLIPFRVSVPREILTHNSPNLLSVIVRYVPDPETTLPPKTRFLGAKIAGGIVRDVFLQFLPAKYFSEIKTDYKLSEDLASAEIDIEGNIYNDQVILDSLNSEELTLGFSIWDSGGNPVVSVTGEKPGNRSLLLSQFKKKFIVKNPFLWTPAVPNCYKLRVELFENGTVIDRVEKKLGFYRLAYESNRLKLNNYVFTFYGTVYHDWSGKYGILFSKEEAETYIKLLKDLGFNSIRFSEVPPHPYMLKLCEDYGLFCLVDIPFTSPTEKSLSRENIEDRMKIYIDSFLKSYGSSFVTAAIGLGSSFTGKSAVEKNFIDMTSEMIRTNSRKLVYASFSGVPLLTAGEVDLLGAELYATPPEKYAATLESIENMNQISKLIFSSVTYPVFNGNSNGYISPFTFDAQAKYFDDLFDFVKRKRISGIFINALTDYRGEYPSLFAGYNSKSIYKVGIIPDLRNTNRLSYQVIKSKTQRTERVSIPIGNGKSNFPPLFIILALAISILMALIINSKRKFREDTNRALLRPYNFFADVRDQRILSDMNSTFLLIILAGTFALLDTNLLYYLRNNILLEKITLSFGSVFLNDFIGYLSWHPLEAFFYLIVINLVKIFMIAILIKIASFFIKNRVLFGSIFTAVVWSLLPTVLILPLLLILYRILIADVINNYIYGFIIMFTIWLVQRVIKGIYVIFDVRPVFVYIFTILFIAFVSIAVLFYFELTESTLSYLILAFKQSASI